MNDLTEIIDRQKKEIVNFIDGVRKESYEYGGQDAIRKEIPKFAEWICKSFDIHRTSDELIDEWLYSMAIAEKIKREGMSDAVTMPATVDEWQRDMQIAYEGGRADVLTEILKLPRLNHYDMYDELMYQSIKVNDIERLREPKEDIQETEPDSIILQDFFKGDSQ